MKGVIYLVKASNIVGLLVVDVVTLNICFLQHQEINLLHRVSEVQH